MSKSVNLAAVLLLWPMVLQAQEKLPTLSEVMAGVQDTKVSLAGFIGRGPEGEPRFVLADDHDSSFPVEFGADAELDAKIEGCGFDGSGGLPCEVVADGYLTWAVPRLKIVVTRIESLSPPKAWE